MLYIFDLDGTLVETYGTRPLQGIPEQLSALVREGHVLAVATNQAGPAWGVATGKPHYPTPQSLGHRFQEVVGLLPPLAGAPWFIAVGDERLDLDPAVYEDLVRAFKEASGSLEVYVSADPGWRKPEPQMLLAACDYYHRPPADAVFVGDTDTDAAAAAATGMRFIPIDELL